MSEPTLAEMIAKWRKRHDDDDDKQSLACCALTCADELAAFHARAKALAEKWERIAENIDDGTHVTECSKRACDFRARAAELRALTGDLQP